MYTSFTSRFSTVPCTRSPSRSDENVSFVRATPLSARCCWCTSSATVWAKKRGLVAGPLYLAIEDRLSRAHVEQPHLEPQPVGRLLDRADQETVSAQLAPAVERHIGQRARRRNRCVGVARDQVELPLERQVLPEHRRDGAGGRRGLGIRRQREEIGHGVLGWCARFPGDAQLDLGLLGGPLLRGACGAGAGAWVATLAPAPARPSRKIRRVGFCDISARIGISDGRSGRSQCTARAGAAAVASPAARAARSDPARRSRSDARSPLH